mmetsp:Transcript_13237/g.33243  ORF Transcript_13237/g.33243 Transcript_13237/m.33243 type:complete len:88 (-) Transcript_13237:1251-1514(-)
MKESTLDVCVYIYSAIVIVTSRAIQRVSKCGAFYAFSKSFKSKRMNQAVSSGFATQTVGNFLFVIASFPVVVNLSPKWMTLVGEHER